MDRDIVLKPDNWPGEIPITKSNYRVCNPYRKRLSNKRVHVPTHIQYTQIVLRGKGNSNTKERLVIFYCDIIFHIVGTGFDTSHVHLLTTETW